MVILGHFGTFKLMQSEWKGQSLFSLSFNESSMIVGVRAHTCVQLR